MKLSILEDGGRTFIVELSSSYSYEMFAPAIHQTTASFRGQSVYLHCSASDASDRLPAQMELSFEELGRLIQAYQWFAGVLPGPVGEVKSGL